MVYLLKFFQNKYLVSIPEINLRGTNFFLGQVSKILSHMQSDILQNFVDNKD